MGAARLDRISLANPVGHWRSSKPEAVGKVRPASRPSATLSLSPLLTYVRVRKEARGTAEALRVEPQIG